MAKDRLNRRKFIRTTSAGLAGLALPAGDLLSKRSVGPFLKSGKFSKKVIVLGMDGLDPNLVRRFVSEGELPTFKKLMEKGYFGELQTTMPPHSPVAWSSFITGTNPGGHGVYDFVLRDPKKFEPYMSTSRTFAGKNSLSLGSWNIPLDSGEAKLMRRGPAFWTELEKHGIDASLYALPANFPVVPGTSKTISGMGTPDLLGSYGTFTYFTDAEIPNAASFVGGRVVPLRIKDHKASTTLSGPPNSFRTDNRPAEIPVVFCRDPWEQVAQIELMDRKIFLKKGEWSEWIPLSFELMPLFASVAGMVRFYVQDVHPKLKIYCSPINIDPMEPILPICTPDNYSRELSQAVGRFYTQGFPTDSKTLSTGIFSNDEYHVLAKYVFDETMRVFNYQFDRFNEGFFFYYFSSTDQNQHMMWRLMDPTHPQYEPNASAETKNAVKYFYKKMDDVLKQVLGKVDESTTLIALSDHGFAPFTREFHISTWLVKNGFTTLTDPSKLGEGEFYQYVDWSRTQAYALGLNGIYLNLEGREPHGIVTPEQADDVRRRIVAALTPFKDPVNGKSVITNVYYPEKIYSGPFVSMAPDLVVGYQRGYRISDEAVLGKFPLDIIGDRTDKWSADHCLDPIVVPGMLLTNRECKSPAPGLWDLAPSILAQFGITAPSEMTGKVVL